MTRTKVLSARIVPNIRGKPVTWLTSLPPNRGPTGTDKQQAATLETVEQRFPLERGTNPATWQNNVGRGREPTEQRINPIRSVFRCSYIHHGNVGYRTDHRIREPDLNMKALTGVNRREGSMVGLYFGRPRCRGDTRAGDIETKVFICGTQCPSREGDVAG